MSSWLSLLVLPAQAYSTSQAYSAPHGFAAKANSVLAKGNIFPDSYFDWIPEFVGASLPGAEAKSLTTTLTSPCWANVTALTVLSGSEVTIHFDAQKPKRSLLCHDFYLLMTNEKYEHHEIILGGKSTATLKDLTAREIADIQAAGVRIFHFAGSEADVLASVAETALLFTGVMSGPAVKDDEALRNIKWLTDYMGGTSGAALDPHFGEVRNASLSDLTPFINEDDIADGDMFCILRLDGLDPLINWGTGGSCGHTVMAMRLGTPPVLHVVESQAKGAYWPKDFVQRNSWADWVANAKAADYNVLWLPLSPASRKAFDAEKAREAFETKYEGLLYGYPNMLWGWFDKGDGSNFPAGKAGRPSPLSNALLAAVFSVLDPLLFGKSEAGGADGPAAKPKVPSLWDGAIGQRLGVPPSQIANTSTAALLALARSRNISFGDLMQMPEQDDWEYVLDDSQCGRAAGCTGPAQVCNVFVCKIWKAGGLFDVDFNCGELTPLDTYSMKIFDDAPTQLPPQCRQADPNSDPRYCQILGKYRNGLGKWYNSVAPYAHQRESCPSQAPAYPQRFGNPTVAATC